jgi:hypothetical protein
VIGAPAGVLIEATFDGVRVRCDEVSDLICERLKVLASPRELEAGVI